MTTTYNIFEHGNRDIRADFHLHTLADPLGIVYKEDEDTFFNNYLDRLEEFKIKFGLIANHNQFYLESQISKGEYVKTGEVKSVSPGIIFPKRPKDKARMKLIEDLFDEEGIPVVWDDESIEECKKRNMS